MRTFPILKNPMFRIFTLTAAASLLIGCFGELDIDTGETQVDFPGASASDNTAGTPNQPGNTATPTGPDGTPTGETAAPAILSNVTQGSRCIAGSAGDFLVLSDVPSDCATDARRLDAFTTSGTLNGAVALELDGSPQFQRTVDYCPTGGTCETVTFNVTLTGGSGTWSATIGGQPRTGQFTASPCSYDTVVEPLPGDSLAAGISVTDVAVYQGVKVPVVENGQMVTDLNAPVVAERPGVIRVFVEPQGDWQQRDVRVKLTLGDLVKEQVFSPAGTSSEMEPSSTVNFDLAAGELPANADFSVEVLENAACATAPGAIAQPRVPADGTQTLGVEGLSQNMRIVLVPIAYDADGSGRLPNLDNAAVERFRAEAFKNYPVPDVEITLRDPISYQGGLAPNGAGFGNALNFCLGLRANDNPDDEVYYYCVFQPADTAQQFCGGGCVAGVAPVPGAGDVGARGGIGISFNGDGEGVFVHEIGHTLGRPHSPCGGAAGTDPNYPYAQGLIGSWGYDIMNGQLFNPDQRADFMGYCNPTWVSDYTYGLIFDRLQSVIGTQQVRVATPPTTWRTAVLEVDGELDWGMNKTLTRLPTGAPAAANLLNAQGVKLGEPRVYVTPVADIDAVLLTVEDMGIAGQTIEVPGIGQLTLP